MKDNKNILIALLGLTAGVLAYAHILFTPQVAKADSVILGKDYSVVTTQVTGGNDGLFVLDHESNKVALFMWDPAAKSVVPKDVKSLDELLAGK
jgi:hypothetical protein